MLRLVLVAAAVQALCSVKVSSGAPVVYFPRDLWFDSPVRVALDGLLSISTTGSSSSSSSDSSSLSSLYDDKTLEHTLGRRDLFTLTYCGQKGIDVNQDRAFALEDDDDNALIKACGVLDGHGDLGHDVAQFARNEIADGLLRLKSSTHTLVVDPSDPTAVSSYLERLVVNADGYLSEDLAMNGGATVSFIVQLGSYVYMVNAGDSQSFLISLTGTTGKVTKVLGATRLDKPQLPDEKERLESMGGRVTLADEYDDARVWYDITDPTTGRSYPVGLAMSRGIGDRACTGVIAQPLIQVFTISELVKQAQSCKEEILNDWGELIACGGDQPVRLLAVSATDGLIDYVNGTMFADFLFRRNMHVFNSAQHIFDKAAQGWEQDMEGTYRDDMSLAVFEVQQSHRETIAQTQ